jgi:hypothetical protein
MLTRLILDRNDRRIVALTEQDVEPILEHAKALANEPKPARRRGDFARHVASVPNVLLVKLLNDEYARGNVGLKMFSPEFNALVAAKLASDWKHFRVG